MPYSEKDIAEINRDPVRMKAYFWRVAMNAKRTALSNRTASRRAGTIHPVNNYKMAHSEGRDLIQDADHMDNFARMILENIDALVASCIKS